MSQPVPKPRITFHLVNSAPVEDIVALYKAGGWWKEGALSRRTIPKMIKNSFVFAVAKTTEGKIIGMGRVLSDGCSDAYIQSVVVLKAYRGLGAGQGIIKTLTRHCTRKKIPWIALVAEPGTYPFYRKLKFKDQKGFQLMLLDQGKKK